MKPPNRRPISAWTLLAIFLTGGVLAAAEPEIVSLEKIWDRAPHNAFTDLIRFEGQWFCLPDKCLVPLQFLSGSGRTPPARPSLAGC